MANSIKQSGIFAAAILFTQAGSTLGAESDQSDAALPNPPECTRERPAPYKTATGSTATVERGDLKLEAESLTYHQKLDTFEASGSVRLTQQDGFQVLGDKASLNLGEKTGEVSNIEFFTTKEGEKGLGLGLAVVYGIVKRHQGDIQVSSTPNEGTIVTITLPREPSVGTGGEAGVGEEATSTPVLRPGGSGSSANHRKERDGE